MSGDRFRAEITEYHKGHEVKGEFKLSLAGEDTLAISIGICPMPTNPSNDHISNCRPSASLAERLESLSSITRLVVSRKDYNDGCGGYDYFITFSEQETDVPLLVATHYGSMLNTQVMFLTKEQEPRPSKFLEVRTLGRGSAPASQQAH